MYYTYILYSEKLAVFYTGHTKDMERRLEEHNRGKSAFAAKGMPWRVVYRFEASSRADAAKLERKIKKRGAQRFLRDLNLQLA